MKRKQKGDTVNIDDVISVYIGKVVSGKKKVEITPECSAGIPRRVYQKELQRDQIILGALKCAKANGFTGE